MNVVGSVSETPMMVRRVTPLPPALIPFFLDNRDGFDIWLDEDAAEIVIRPKEGAEVSAASRKRLQSLLPQQERPTVVPGHPRTAPILRPKFTYTATDMGYTPEQAKRFGLSAPRLLIYGLIHAAGTEGVGYKVLREKSKLPHGSVMQVLHWLRKQKLIVGEPD